MAYNYEYPYTDPYRYNDDWLLRKMKDLTEEWAAMQKQFADLQTAFNDLKNYVMNYFANLDLTQEVSDKIDSMVSSGELDAILEPIVKKYFVPGSPFYGKNVIWISDSWGRSGSYGVTTPHQVLVSQALGFNLISLAAGSTGYVIGGSNNYEGRLRNWVTAGGDVNTISYIVAFGSINDLGQTTLRSAVTQFINYAKATFPYAQIIIIPCPGNPNLSLPTDSYDWFNVYYQTLAAAYNARVRYVNLFGIFIAQDSVFNSDYVHPTQIGQNTLASYIVQDLLGNPSFTSFGGQNIMLTGSDGTTVQLIVSYTKNVMQVGVIATLKSSNVEIPVPHFKGIGMPMPYTYVTVKMLSTFGYLLYYRSTNVLRLSSTEEITSDTPVYGYFEIPIN